MSASENRCNPPWFIRKGTDLAFAAILGAGLATFSDHWFVWPLAAIGFLVALKRWPEEQP